MKNKILSVVLAVLCMLSLIPFAAFAEGSYTVVYDKHVWTPSAFERPWSQQGNYDVQGYIFETTEFDGETVVAISRDANVEDVYAYRAADGASTTNFYTNLFSYGVFKLAGKPVRLYDSQYITIEYYYDTTGREGVEDESFTDLEGKVPYFTGQQGVTVNGSLVKGSVPSGSASSGIVANEWDTMVIDLSADIANKYPAALTTEIDTYGLYQLKLDIFGSATAIDPHKGDVFYLKGITFSSYPLDMDDTDLPSPVVTVYDYYGEYIYDSIESDEWYTPFDTYTVPEYTGELPEGCEFLYFVESSTGKIYNPGDVVALNIGYVDEDGVGVYDVILEPVVLAPTDVTFVVDEETSFTVGWFEGTQATMPAAPETPEGLLFAGWSDGETTYKPGSLYAFDGSVTEFTAVFKTPGTYYLSADGSIEGVDDVIYTTFAAVDAEVSANGGVGTVYVEGDIALGSAVTFASTDLIFKAYDETAKIWISGGLEPSGGYMTRLASENGTSIVFDDVCIRRADTYTDEAWIKLVNIDLTFGENCTYESGKRTKSSTDFTLTSTVLNLYFSQNTTETGGFSITVDSPEVTFAMLTSGGQWATTGYTHTGNYNYTLNDGIYSTFAVASRNGNGKCTPEIFNGNINAEINGGTFKDVFLCNYASTISGDVIINVNGGKITTFSNGDSGINAAGNISSIGGNFITVINAADMTAAPKVVAGNAPEVAGAYVLVYNNVELAEEAPASNAKQLVKVTEGVATPKVSGTDVVYTITPDDDSYDQVLANGEVITPDAKGYYALPQGDVSITFGKEGQQTYEVAYMNGDDKVVIGNYYAGSEVVLPALGAIGNAVVDGYKLGDTTYAAGDKIVVGTEDIVLELVLYINETNTWYVASNGDDKAAGYKASAPYATVAKALSSIGTKDGIIVLMDMVYNFPGSISLAADQHVVITGEGYENAGFANGKSRVAINSGHLELKHLLDYNNETGDTNTPFILKAGELTIGEGYKLAVLRSGVMTVINDGTQIETGSTNGSVTANLNGDMQFFTLADWGNATVNGDLTVNVGPKANFSGVQSGSTVVLGGDSGSNAIKAKVTGKTYINVDGVQAENRFIYKTGFKKTVSTELNGLQILLKNTNLTVADHPSFLDESSTATYVNNGAEYIVKTNTVFGTDVVLPEFGKATITLVDNVVAKVTDSLGTRTIEESCTIDLAEGNTTIEFQSDSVVTVTDGDTINVQLNGGSMYTLPTLEVAEGEKHIGWYIGDEFYAVGTEYQLPLEGTVTLEAFIIGADAHVYIDTANGDDANLGFAPEMAVKSIDKAMSVINGFADEATLHVIGELSSGSATLNIPAFNGVLTITGKDTNGVLAYGETLSINSAVVLEDIGYKANVNWKHIMLGGNSLTFGKGAYKAEGSQGVNIHAGKYNADMTADQSIIVYEGYIDQIQMGPYYNSAPRTWNGDFYFEIGGEGSNGAQVNIIKYGDSYNNTTDKQITHNGNVLGYIHENGTVNNIQSYGLCKTTNGTFVVVNESSVVPELGMDADDLTYLLNATSVFGACEGSLVVEDDAYFVVEDAEYYVLETGENAVDGKVKVSTGVNTLVAGKSVKNEGLTIEGAQIRLPGQSAQGLRFIAKYTDELAAQYEGAEYGYVVLPKAVLGNNALVVGGEYTYEGRTYTAEKVVAERLYADAEDHVLYTVCLTGLEADQYKTEYVAVTYIKTADGYVYGEQYATSVYKVAEAVIADENETDEALKASMQELLDAANA